MLILPGASVCNVLPVVKEVLATCGASLYTLFEYQAEPSLLTDSNVTTNITIGTGWSVNRRATVLASSFDTHREP